MIYIAFTLGEKKPDLVIGLLGATLGGLFTFLGVNISLKYTRRMNYGRFYLHFNKSQIYINSFLIESEFISEKLRGFERSELRFLHFNEDLNDLKMYIDSTIKTLNKDISEIDYNHLDVVILDINENAPIEYYYDMNFIIIIMADIYNSILKDGKYLINDKPDPINFNNINRINTGKPHSKQVKILEKRYKKVKRNMKLK